VTVSLGRAVSVYEMLQVIGRAKVAERQMRTAVEITEWLRSLDTTAVVDEYHRAVVLLLNKGLLSPKEQREVNEYARDWVDSAPMGI
jgi:hypothetical protein